MIKALLISGITIPTVAALVSATVRHWWGKRLHRRDEGRP